MPQPSPHIVKLPVLPAAKRQQHNRKGANLLLGGRQEARGYRRLDGTVPGELILHVRTWSSSHPKPNTLRRRLQLRTNFLSAPNQNRSGRQEPKLNRNDSVPTAIRPARGTNLATGTGALAEIFADNPRSCSTIRPRCVAKNDGPNPQSPPTAPESASSGAAAGGCSSRQQHVVLRLPSPGITCRKPSSLRAVVYASF